MFKYPKSSFKRKVMSYILVSNVGPLIAKYHRTISNEIKDLFTSLQIPMNDHDLIDWFEWSFNHILKEHFFLNVRSHYVNYNYQNLFNTIELEYSRSFLVCIDEGNHRILRNLSEFLTVKAVLTNETLIIVASPKIEL